MNFMSKFKGKTSTIPNNVDFSKSSRASGRLDIDFRDRAISSEVRRDTRRKGRGWRRHREQRGIRRGISGKGRG